MDEVMRDDKWIPLEAFKPSLRNYVATKRATDPDWMPSVLTQREYKSQADRLSSTLEELMKEIINNDCPRELLGGSKQRHEIELHCCIIAFTYNTKTEEIANVGWV
jgi:hypothetical protein